MSNSRRSGACLRCCLVVVAVASALYVSGPALQHWRSKKGIRFASSSSSSSSSCGPCVCDCPPPLSLHNLAPGLLNLSVSDCGKDDPDLNKEMEKQLVDLVTEELKLQEVVAGEHAHHMNLTLADARRLASQYREEAEKCNAATETCEEARERAEASLTKEKKMTSTWEKRARQLGWAGE